MEFSWISDLDSPRSVEPCCDPAILASTGTLLGDGPVRWAIATAESVTQHIISSIPADPSGPAPFETLRRGVEAMVLTCLCALVDGQEAAYAVPADGVDTIRDCVHRGIPLDQMLRGIRVGHAFLHRALRDGAPDGEMPAMITEALFEQVDRLTGELAEVYVAERDRWEVSEEGARWRTVEAIVAGEHPDPVTAERILDYALDRYHVALILWREGAADTGATTADQLAADLLAACGGESLLRVGGHARTVWVWVGFGAWPSSGLSWPPGLPTGWRAAAGPPSYGPAGMRRSHLGARRAARIAETMPAEGGVCDYGDVRTACLLTADAEHARWYMDETLGPLGAADDWSGQLRDTLRCYLASGRSLKTTAAQLGVARNTVAYRVKRAEELLGSSDVVDQLEVRLALEIRRFADVLEARPLAEPDGSPGALRQMYVKGELVL
ncbi:PucR family transcriptional regulator [Streptomyces sp. NPDC101455]|uniref:PucR family transcriptional regulator n=1 Tax=Streptomyces sp. NPDC101455 TaxID=3366142 RepID=UPI003812FE37